MRMLAPVLLGVASMPLAPGCGCKRPSVVGMPEIVSYTFGPAPAERLARGRSALGGRAADPAAEAKARTLDELAAAQESLRTGARSDAVGFLSRQICPALGESGGDCVKSVQPFTLVPSAERSLKAAAPPEQYLVCLKRPVTVPEGTRAARFLSPIVTETGGVLQPNVRWRIVEPRPPKEPSPDEKLAHQASKANVDWAQKQIDYAGALAQLGTRRPGQGPGEGVVVVHLDTGFTPSCQLQKSPPDATLVLAASQGFDYFSCQNEPSDPLTEVALPLEARQPGHGTGTSSILASPQVSPDCHPPEPADGAGRPMDRVVGIAPAATVIPVRVTDGIILGFPEASKAIMEWQGVSFDARVRALIAGVFHAIDRDASVISISMGGVCADDEVQHKNNEELQHWMNEAEGRGIIIVAAAGQFPIPGFLRRLFFEGYPVAFPGSFPSTVAVAASSIYGLPWTQSSRGPKVDVTAPGFGVWRAKPRLGGPTPEDDVDIGDGTSFSTAITAGVAALWVQYWGKDWLHERYGAATAAAFRLVLHRSAQEPADLAARLKNETYASEIKKRARRWDTKQFGAGILNAAALLAVDMERVSKDEVCRGEATRLSGDADPAWQTHYDRICGSDNASIEPNTLGGHPKPATEGHLKTGHHE